MQYAGAGLWGKNYSLRQPTRIRYAILPHRANWQSAQLNKAATCWNQYLIAQENNPGFPEHSLVAHLDPGCEISALYYHNKDLYVRIMNTGTSQATYRIALNATADTSQSVNLDESIDATIPLGTQQHISFEYQIPLFGFKTFRLVNAQPLLESL